MDGYIAAKRRIFARPGRDGHRDHRHRRRDLPRSSADELRRGGPARVVPISVREPVPGGVYVDDGWLVDALDGQPRAGSRPRPRPSGCPARTTGRTPPPPTPRRAPPAFGTRRGDRRDPLFPGPRAPTRTGRHDRRRTLYQRFEGHQRRRDRKGARVLSGDLLDRRRACPRQAGSRRSRRYFERLRHAFLIGTRDGGVCGDARRLGPLHPLRRSRDRASRRRRERARRDGVPGAVVLLSPACASYDQFANFEVRGDTFRRLVAELARSGSAGRRMMFARIDQSPVARWWWTVDRWSLGALALLIGVRRGDEHGGEPRRRRAARLRRRCISPSATWSPCRSRWRSCSACRCCRRARSAASPSSALRSRSSLLALTFVIGVEIKGARRWINLPGLSLQPSEFVKPTFAIVAAWLFAEQKQQPRFPGNAISIGAVPR